VTTVATPLLAAVPGLGLSAAVPRHTLDRLRGVASLVVELPGFGLPAAPRDSLHPAALADRLLDRLEAVGAGPAVLFGHSASCQLVAQAAARAPRHVTGLVLVGPTTDPRGAGWPSLVGRWLRTAGHERPGQVPQLVRDYTHTGLRCMARGMDVARRDRIDAALALVRCPVLVVRGRHDRIAPREWTERLAGLVPRGEALTLPAGGHMVPITHPAPLAAAMHEFLQATAG
jgi:pimeloyl-ACP methyl ester carboxylesterase